MSSCNFAFIVSSPFYVFFNELLVFTIPFDLRHQLLFPDPAGIRAVFLNFKLVGISRARGDQIGVGFRRLKLLTMRKRIGIVAIKILFVSPPIAVLLKILADPFVIRLLLVALRLEHLVHIFDNLPILMPPARPEGLISRGVVNIEQFPGQRIDGGNTERIIVQIRQNIAEIFDEDGIIQVDHAGLECSIILGKYPHLDVVSFGPTMKSPHTTTERALIKTVEPFWTLLKKTLEDIPEK